MLNPGDVFGRLTVIEQDHVDNKSQRFYKCKCNCDKKTIVVVRESSLKGNHTKSCGCFRKEICYNMRKVRNNNVCCSQCGKAEHYAKGLCKNCYTLQKRGVDNRSYAFPTNILLIIGVPMQNIVQEVQDRFISFINSGVITNRQKNMLYDYYRDQKTYEMIGKEYGITRERVRQILNSGLKVLGNIDSVDYILGITPYKDRIKELQQQIKLLEQLKNQIIETISDDQNEPLKDIPIYSIQELSRRARNGLMHNHIKTLYDLAQLPKDGYKKLQSVGKNTWAEIVEKSAAYGVVLR